MTKFVKLLLSVLFLFQLGKNCYATWNFFDAHLYIPFFDYLWKFDEDCQVRCHRISIKCLFPASQYSVCRDLRFMHECCEQFRSTTTTTSTTTQSTTTSTEDPIVGLCTPTRPEMCQPEPGCSLSTYSGPFWMKWLRQPGCEHKCWEHCFDPCACKTAANGNCEYHAFTGMCIARQTCQELTFNEGACRRASSFYSIGGVLCHNQESTQTNCENGTTIFAVNINGGPHTDKRGILYVEDNEEFYDDEFNTRVIINDGIGEVADVDKILYGNYAIGKANGIEIGQCLQYSLVVENDGNFELAIRTFEPRYKRVGHRIFSLTLNHVPIILHVDLRALSVDKSAPVDILVNFRIQTAPDRRVIIVKGHPQMDFTGNLQVGLCISDCHLCEEYSRYDPGYVGSGISLVRF